MTRNDFLDSSIKYYSFKIGNPKQRKNNWILHDWKLPAVDVRMAVSMLYITMQFSDNIRRNEIFNRAKTYEMPSKTWCNTFLCQTIEYTRLYTPKKGYTEHRYKKLKIYNTHDIEKYFREHYSTLKTFRYYERILEEKRGEM